MRESLAIMSQCLDFLTLFAENDNYDFMIPDYKIAPPSRAFMKSSMNR